MRYVMPGWSRYRTARTASCRTTSSSGSRSSGALAEHSFPEERGKVYAAHFALTHACWLVTYPVVGHAAARWGAPHTFTVAGVVCLLITLVAWLMGGSRGAHVHSPPTTMS